MKRLTGIDSKGWYAPIGADFKKRQRGEAITRLGRYEDTGLTSKEILEAKALMEAREFAMKARLELLKERLRTEKLREKKSDLRKDTTAAYFYRGRAEAIEQEIDWMGRLVNDG